MHFSSETTDCCRNVKDSVRCGYREYAMHIPTPAPARTTTAAALAHGALVEIDALAVFD